MRKLAGMVAVLLALASSSAADEGLGKREPIAEGPFFVFYSHFVFNLYDAFLTSATARTAHRSEPLPGEARECFDGLPREARSAWDAAVDYFATNVAATRDFSPERDRFRSYLNEFETEPEESEDRAALELGVLFLRAAAPAYRACRWAERDHANRAWISALLPRLERDGAAIAGEVQRLFGESWRSLPIPVDVVETVGWSGADTLGWPRTHIQIASGRATYGGPAALEMIFHEASHELVGRRGTIAGLLAESASAAGIPVPRNLWHGLLFVTVGEVVRSRLAERGEAGYIPYAEANGVFDGFWKPFLEPLRAEWLPYVRGEADPASAAGALLSALAKAEP